MDQFSLGLFKSGVFDFGEKVEHCTRKKYCDEAGLMGSHRESVIEKNGATPYAPCGNASCTNVETS